MDTLDPFGRTDRLDQDTLETLAIRFEVRGQHPVFAQMLHEYLDAMQINDQEAVLDLGCGTGLAARVIARQPDFEGKVTGIDLSQFLVMMANRLAESEGLAGQTDFLAGDAHNLHFEDGSFHAAVAHTLLSHVEDPPAVLHEAARVLKPGGLLGIFDGDYASLTFGQADAAKGARFDNALKNAVVTNPRVMRQVPRLLHAAGFELVHVFPYTLTEAGKANFWLSAIEAYRRLLPSTGAVRKEEADAWAASLQMDSEIGVFFGSCNYYAYIARRR
jgi:ubiquinone/menaquinone biosynthesis C-methylase UbiE